MTLYPTATCEEACNGAVLASQVMSVGHEASANTRRASGWT